MQLINKKLFFKYLGILYLCGVSVQAAPRIDTAVGTDPALMLTVLPDDKDPNLYYFFPNSFHVARKDGRAEFSYHEVNGFFIVKEAYVVAAVSANMPNDLEKKLVSIKAQNPNAKFTPVTLLRSNVSAPKIQTPLIDSSECQSNGNLLGQEIGCQININVKNRELFIKAARRQLTNVIFLDYSFMAVRGSALVEVSQSLPIIIGEVGDGNYFFDGDDRPIPDTQMEAYLAAKRKKDEYYNKYLKVKVDERRELAEILKFCAGTHSSDECLMVINQKATSDKLNLLSRFADVNGRAGSDPFRYMTRRMQDIQSSIDEDQEWSEINRKVNELEKEVRLLGI